MSRRKYLWNTFQTTLSSAIDASQTTIGLASVTNLRSPGFLVIEHDNPAKYEVVSFSGISSLDLTGCQRGLGGSVGGTGSSHVSGVAVRCVMLHQIVDDAFSDIEDLEAVDVLIEAAIADLEAADTAHFGTGGTAHATVSPGGDAGFIDGSDKAKLDGIEAGATGDQTPAEIVTAAAPTIVNATRVTDSQFGLSTVTVDSLSPTAFFDYQVDIIPTDWVTYSMEFWISGVAKKLSGASVGNDLTISTSILEDAGTVGNTTLSEILNFAGEFETDAFMLRGVNVNPITRATRPLPRVRVLGNVSIAEDINLLNLSFGMVAWRLS